MSKWLTLALLFAQDAVNEPKPVRYNIQLKPTFLISCDMQYMYNNRSNDKRGTIMPRLRISQAIVQEFVHYIHNPVLKGRRRFIVNKLIRD